jgi:RNA polymerase sigma-70 factor (ECF subfamily)
MSVRTMQAYQAAPAEPETAGHPFDLERIFRQHAVTVSGWAARLGGPTIDVEDAVQEVFMVAHRRLGEFRGEAKISTWLFRITERVARHQRRRARWRRWLRGSAVDVGGQLPALHDDPVETMQRKQAAAQVYGVLDQLSEKLRTVLILANFDDLEPAEIAAMTGLHPTTARVRLHRAREQYRRIAQARGAGQSW